MRATLENTVFYSVAAYEYPDTVTAPLRRTAEHFGIPLQFPIYGGSHCSNYDTKIVRSLPILERWYQEGKEHCFFVDARDTVFVDTAENILKAYNALNLAGVLFNVDKMNTPWPLGCNEMREKITERFGATGFVNSGLFACRLDNLIALWRKCIELHDYICRNDYTHPALIHFCNATKAEIQRGQDQWSKSDQFPIQLLQTVGCNDIQVDREKRLLSLFDDPPFPSLRHRQSERFAGDIQYIGKAKILHSPWMSQQPLLWNCWIKDEICN
jgi:hypothetical protein